MCGIVGTLRFSGEKPVDLTKLERMRDAMAHRGPDGAGSWLSGDQSVALGHRRLSIIDLTQAANQPMGTLEGQVQLVFNGEIYNHQEIRKELQNLGHHFTTDHSDTEVLLRSYIEWGHECVHKLIGMFAFAIWDARKQELWLVRDRIGVKPLYYAVYNGRISFASEIKALLQDEDLPRKVNELSMLQYMSFLAPPAPNTMYDGIQKLAGGGSLLVKVDGQLKEKRYWDALDQRKDLSHLSDKEVSDLVLENLEEAVARRMVSDVPVGVFLSGGIDSSTNAALFSRHTNQKVKTFSIGYDQDYGSYKNELTYAKEVADYIGTDHYELRLTQQDLVDFLPHMVDLQDEPIGDPVCVPVYYVSKLAKENGVTVCQVGEGSDELFWGYPNWRRALRMQNLSDQFSCVPSAVKKLGLSALKLAGKHASLPHDWLMRSSQDRPIFFGGAEALPHHMRLSLMSQDMIKRHGVDTSWAAIEPIWQRFQEKGGGSRLKWMTYLDLNFRLPELLLMRVDKMSMGVSLEGRVPFLDHRFVEMALSIREEVLTRDDVLKTVLKRAVRGVIPDHIIDRPKQGFGVPVHDWMMAELGEHARDVINDFVGKTDYFDAAAIHALLNSGRSADIWNLLNLAMWWKRYISV